VAETITNGSRDRGDILFAHGAGAPMDHPFMSSYAEALALEGFRVIRFEFPYMAKRRLDGKRRGPDRAPALLECFAEMIRAVKRPNIPLIIAGKSMGGRMATMLAAATDESDYAPIHHMIDGSFVLGYPFHPPGKPEKLRTAHLPDIMVPTIICQGERDPFGRRDEVEGYDIGDVSLCWIPDGDHSFKPRKSSGHLEASNQQIAVRAIDAFFQ